MTREEEEEEVEGDELARADVQGEVAEPVARRRRGGAALGVAFSFTAAAAGEDEAGEGRSAVASGGRGGASRCLCC